MSDSFSPLDGSSPATSSPTVPTLPSLPPREVRAPFGSVAPQLPPAEPGAVHPGAPFGPGPSFGPGASFGPGPAFGSTPPKRKKSRAGWWVLLGLTLAALVGAGVWTVVRKVQEATSMPVESVPAAVVPADAVSATGVSGWIMQISPAWTAIDVSTTEVEGGWFTGSGSTDFSNNVTVSSETPRVDIGLAAYMRLSAEKAPSQLSGGVVISNHLFNDGAHEFGRMEFSGTVNGRVLKFVAYVVKVRSKFVIVTYAASIDTFATSLAGVEPYIVTVAAQ